MPFFSARRKVDPKGNPQRLPNRSSSVPRRARSRHSKAHWPPPACDVLRGARWHSARFSVHQTRSGADARRSQAGRARRPRKRARRSGGRVSVAGDVACRGRLRDAATECATWPLAVSVIALSRLEKGGRVRPPPNRRPLSDPRHLLRRRRVKVGESPHGLWRDTAAPRGALLGRQLPRVARRCALARREGDAKPGAARAGRRRFAARATKDRAHARVRGAVRRRLPVLAMGRARPRRHVHCIRGDHDRGDLHTAQRDLRSRAEPERLELLRGLVAQADRRARGTERRERQHCDGEHGARDGTRARRGGNGRPAVATRDERDGGHRRRFARLLLPPAVDREYGWGHARGPEAPMRAEFGRY